MTKEEDLILSFATEIVRPWEELNRELSKHYSVSPQHSVFLNKAYALAISLKHIAEAKTGLKSPELNSLSESYKLISDLADTKKHGKRDNPNREYTITTSSLYERKFENIVLVRFLRNAITIHHATTDAKKDFMECAKDCALFLVNQLNIQTDWNPIVFNNFGEFSNKIETHASIDNQVIWTGMNLNWVELNERNEYDFVDINGTIEFNLTSEF
jgi:hypothetical protein